MCITRPVGVRASSPHGGQDGRPPRQSAAPRPAHLEPAPLLPDERGLAWRQRIVNRSRLSLLLTRSRRQAIMLRLFSTGEQKPILC